MLCRILCVLLFVAWTAEPPNDTVLYVGLWRSPLGLLAPLFTSLPGINLFPWQLMLVGLAPVCLLSPGAFRKRGWMIDAAILLCVASIAVTFLWGWLRGGSAYNAYYQLWRFLAGLVVAALLLSVIRSSRDLRVLGLTILTAALVRGSLVVYFYWAHVHGKLDPPPQWMTNHDDSVLFVAALLITLSWALARGGWATWLTTILLWVHLVYAMVLNNRRLAWIELVLSLAVLYPLLPPGGWRRRVNRWLLVAVPVVLVYLVVGWERPGAVFAPARALSTSGSNEDASSLARLEEMRNLMYTMSVAGNPLLGTGWGHPYQKFTSVYANFGDSWWQYLYLPHNSLLGVVVFGGLVGIFGILFVVPVTAFLATRGFRGATVAVDRAAGMTALSILPAYAGQCYGDIGFQSLTGGLILGVAMAVAGKLSAWGGVRAGVSRDSRVAAANASLSPRLIPAPRHPRE